jgi:hypothetical protein
MKRFAALLVLPLLLTQLARAGNYSGETVAQDDKTVPRDIAEIESSYVFESDLNHGGSFGKQDELENQIGYAHRFHLNGNLYLRAGFEYKRFDFGRTSAPVPLHLQSGAAVISIDYMHGKDIGALLQIQPGIYTENNIDLDSFDCPITLARFWVLQPDKLYILTGARAAFLRGGFPVIPLVGVVWYPSEKIKLMGILPDPKLIYSVNPQLDLWIGGEIAGGAFRTDHHDEFRNIRHVAKLSGTQVDYSDYRAGVGLTYTPLSQVEINLGGGYAIQRSFNFHRAGEYYRTDPAPYLQVEIKAKF